MNPSCPNQAPIAQSTMTAKEYWMGMLKNAEKDFTQGVDGVEAEADGDEGRGVVQSGLHWVHVGSGEGGWVVGLVM